MKVRIKFSRKGPLRFLGHLDIMRYFQKAIRRSGIEIAYTTGYSPHQILSFAAPMGVGLESEGEYFDIEVTSLTSSDDFKNRLDAQMVNGISIEDVRCLDEHTTNAMASVSAASYEVTFRPEYCIPFSLEEAFSKWNESTEVLQTKEGKRGTTTVRNLKQSVYELSVTERTVSMLVNASSSGNVKPVAVMEALFSFYDVPFDPNSVCLLRKDTFTYNEDKACHIPLSEVGMTF